MPRKFQLCIHLFLVFCQEISCYHHYSDVVMGAIASQITSLTIVYSIVYSDADHRKHQSSASLAFVRGIHWGPVNSPHKWPVTRKMFPFDDVIMINFMCYTIWRYLVGYLEWRVSISEFVFGIVIVQETTGEIDMPDISIIIVNVDSLTTLITKI